MTKWLSAASLLLIISAALLAAPPRLAAQTQPAQTQDQQAPAPQYTPTPVFCADPNTKGLCAIVPAYIGADPRLKNIDGYDGLYGPPPTTSAGDVETPFDNMAWQMFVALNWAANAVKSPAAEGLTQAGPRVWQTYPKVSSLFGNAPVRAPCTSQLALPIFAIGSDGNGKPSPNNEEYLQASTNLPLIDINGNWTIFERRVNTIEAAYLKAPNGQPSQTLTTIQGQLAFTSKNPNGVQFTSSATVTDGKNGSMEIKAAWRILDRSKGDDPSRYYTQNAFLAVAGDLVSNGRPFCKTVQLGLVGMHILQRNPAFKENAALLPQWIWATFEHVDNAPMAQLPCNVRNGCGTQPTTNWINKATCGHAAPQSSVRYSYFQQNASVPGTNISPQPPGITKTLFPWAPNEPFARLGTTPPTGKPQAVRCWSIYVTTDQLNQQWRAALGAVKSVFQNYMVVGTQWGASIEPEPPNPVPTDAVPGMLSNITLETYIQNYTGSDKKLPGPGSCIGCHVHAPLPANGKPADFSFLPLLADPATARARVRTAE